MVLANSTDGGATWNVRLFAHDDRFGKACCDPTLSWDAVRQPLHGVARPRGLGRHPGRDQHRRRPARSGMLKVLRPNPPGGRARTDGHGARKRKKKREKPGGVEKEREPSPKGSSVDQPTIVDGRGIRLAHVEQQRHHAGVRARACPGLGRSGSSPSARTSRRPGTAASATSRSGPTGRSSRCARRTRRERTRRSPPSAPPPIPTAWVRRGSRRPRASRRPTCSSSTAITPQRSRTVDAETGLAWDTVATSPHFGRLYLLWTDEQPNESNDTDIWLRSSDDAGVTWSAPVRVNDVTTNAQFLPRIALDPTTGNLAFGWHDARNDAGDNGPGDTDGKPNTDAMYYVTFSTDGGATFAPAVAASTGVSNAKAAQNGDRLRRLQRSGVLRRRRDARVVGQLRTARETTPGARSRRSTSTWHA